MDDRENAAVTQTTYITYVQPTSIFPAVYPKQCCDHKPFERNRTLQKWHETVARSTNLAKISSCRAHGGAAERLSYTLA